MRRFSLWDPEPQTVVAESRSCSVMEGLSSPSRHLEGQGELVSGLVTPITHIVALSIPITNLLTKSTDLQTALQAGLSC